MASAHSKPKRASGSAVSATYSFLQMEQVSCDHCRFARNSFLRHSRCAKRRLPRHGQGATRSPGARQMRHVAWPRDLLRLRSKPLGVRDPLPWREDVEVDPESLAVQPVWCRSSLYDISTSSRSIESRPPGRETCSFLLLKDDVLALEAVTKHVFTACCTARDPTQNHVQGKHCLPCSTMSHQPLTAHALRLVSLVHLHLPQVSQKAFSTPSHIGQHGVISWPSSPAPSFSFSSHRKGRRRRVNGP